jgi:PAT family beta-lactamase induction signal transducer AmpG
VNGAKILEWFCSLRLYLKPRLITIFLLGFFAGLPFLLMFGTLTAWLAQSGINKTTIGLFVFTSMPFAIKFLWAPFVDKLPIPVFCDLLGQRRGWLCLAQLVCLTCLIGISVTNPSFGLSHLAVWTIGLSFASATQDIVIDAYRIESLDDNEQGLGAASYQLGYRLALIAAGAGALLLADTVGWVVTYQIMASLMAVGVLTTLLIAEPQPSGVKPPDARTRSLSYWAWIHGAVIEPFREFMSRPGWLLILVFVAFYKYADGIWAAMANPFYLDLGFTLSQIGLISKTYGVVMTIVGSLLGGVIVVTIGVGRSVMLGVIIMALTNLLYALLAWAGPSITGLIWVISIENICNGIGGTAFIAYLSILCNKAYTATQYALLTSFMNLSRTFLASGGGFLADQFDWPTFFIITALAGVPGILLFFYLTRRYPNHLSVN